MQNFIQKSFLILVLAGLIFSCKPKLESPSADKGNLDVSKYVAIGNSITAGYADNALYYDGQAVSYANLLAQQFQQIGGGEFRIPFMPAGVGIGSSGNPKLVLALKADCKNIESLSPVPSAVSGDLAGLFTSVAANGPFNNMGVPGAKAITVVYPGFGDPTKGFGNFNPFFTRMLNPAEYSTASMLDKAIEQNPTFFSLFIGNNDVLGYASSGGTSDAITPLDGPPGVGFNESIDAIINKLTTISAKGVVANIPDLTNLPYFSTVPYNGLQVSRQTQVDSLNYLHETAKISFSLGANAFVMAVPFPPFERKMNPGELVLLSAPQDSIKCAGWGSKKPFANQFVLTQTEITNVQTAINNYNNKLKEVAAAKGFAFVDVNAFMSNAKKGIVYNGVNINTSFVSGGAFSLDGVHLTPLGNALLANEFIKAINSTYKSSIPLIEASKFSGVTFP
jgi:hypothetical protein